MMNARETYWLLETLCVDGGYCLPPAIREQLIAAPPQTAEAFATAVFVAEGLDPFLDEKLYLDVLETVAKAFQRSAERDA
jgi:hypothetical protein